MQNEKSQKEEYSVKEDNQKSCISNMQMIYDQSDVHAKPGPQEESGYSGIKDIDN